MSKKSAGWSSKGWNSKATWQRSAVEDAGQEEQLKTSSKVERGFPQRGGIGNACERKEKHLDQKLKGKFKKRNRSITLFQKVWLKTRKLMRHENFWKKRQHNVDEAQERAWSSVCAGSSRNTCTRGKEKLEDRTTTLVGVRWFHARD